MKHVPRTPRDGINVSDQHPLSEAAILIAGLAAILLGIALIAVFFVDLVMLFLSPRFEAKLFQDLMVDELVAAEYDSDSAQSLQKQVDALAMSWPDNPYEFRAGILSAGQPNALALPGGVILVTESLLQQAESENELAFIIGHEIGHFRNRDHIRQLGRAALLSLLATALLGKNAEALTGKIIGLTILSFSRDQETAADGFGLRLVFEVYGHVDQASRFFERIASEEGELDIFAKYSASHPSPDDRVDQLAQLARRNDWPLNGPITPLGSNR